MYVLSASLNFILDVFKRDAPTVYSDNYITDGIVLRMFHYITRNMLSSHLPHTVCTHERWVLAGSSTHGAVLSVPEISF